MNYWFISDWHFGHTNIIKYENRPFQSIHEMNEEIVRRHNERVKVGDTVFFLGDAGFFASKNAEGRGEGLAIPPKTQMSRMNGYIVYIKGNHDTLANKTFTPVHYIILKLGGLQIQLIHKPEDANLDNNLIIHGHTHSRNATTERIDNNGVPTLLINTSVEQHNYYPFSFDEIKRIWDIWLKTHNQKLQILQKVRRNLHARNN